MAPPLELPTEDASPEDQARTAAAALFLERARAVGVALEPDAATAQVVAAICRRLDGLPLAIELAAAWTRVLPPPALLARLERRLPLLVGGPHDLPARQRTMRDAIAWSYDLLDAPERRLFRRLAVFVGGCTLAAAEAVGVEPAPPHADSPAATLVLLAVLVDRSVLRREDGEQGGTEPRLMYLETIREYGLEQLEEHGEGEAARERHAAYYLALAEAAEAALRGGTMPRRRATTRRHARWPQPWATTSERRRRCRAWPTPWGSRATWSGPACWPSNAWPPSARSGTRMAWPRHSSV